MVVLFSTNPLVGLILLLMSVIALISVKIHRNPTQEQPTGDSPLDTPVAEDNDADMLTEDTTTVLEEEPMEEVPEEVVPYDTKLEEMKSGTFHLNEKGDPSKVAILFGINHCDPNVYQGDRLELKGCVNDSRSTLTYLLRKGFGKIWYNEDADCSIANFLRVWKEATKDLKDGDTLVLQMSRHGMSLGINVLDQKGDTETTQGGIKGDQAAVMYDGVIVDDCFWRLFMLLPKVKLIFINDSCHSGSQYRVANFNLSGKAKNTPYRKARSVGREYLPKKDNVLDTEQLDREFGKIPADAVQEFDLISISGCQDWQTSSDAYFNGKYAGAMTYCLLSALHSNSRQPLSALGKRLTALLKQKGFDQEPKITVEGDQSLLSKPLF
jgi:hypothetical protein